MSSSDDEIYEWSGFKQKKIGVDLGCCRCVHVTVIMEHHPSLICRFKLFPRPPPPILAKELGGWLSLLKQPDLVY
jgi:hypothetical protein